MRPLFTLTILVSVTWSTPVGAGDNYAILVGVADYDEKELRPLKFTRADVLDFHAALLDSGFAAKNVVLMHDDFSKLVTHYQKLGKDFKPKDYIPTGANIRKEVELTLGRLRPDDSVIVALAGHGVQFKGDEKSYFCPSDAALNRKDSLIAFEEIYAALKDSSASRKLFLVDACQNDPQSEISRSRATIDLDSVTRPQTESVPEGIIALFSCKAGQKAFEHPPLGHGVFFYHLLDGWKGRGDLNGDGQLSYQELATYTEKKTAEYAALKLKVLQTPVLKNEFSGGEWVLRIVPPPPFDAKNGKTARDAKTSQEAWAKHLKTSVEVQNSIGMKMRLIPPGEYKRGSTPEEAHEATRTNKAVKKDDAKVELPQHAVKISKPFFLGAAEVDRGQFRRFVNATGHVTDAEKEGGWGIDLGSGKIELKTKYNWKDSGFPQTDEHPVTNVSWNDAKAFLEWLSKMENRRYRLPTEAEWEYACRAGTITKFWNGDEFEALKGTANVADKSINRIAFFGSKYSDLAWDDGYRFTSPTGKFKVNGFGLCDMHGNVQEWCADWFDGNEYANYGGRTAVDPTGPESGKLRVMRGGSWSVRPEFLRSASRSRSVPDGPSCLSGYRVVLDVDGE